MDQQAPVVPHKVGVVIPAYNSAQTIGATLESVLNQKDASLSAIVVVDDGSVDATVAIVERYRSGDDRIQCLKNDGKGPARARNYGAKRAAETCDILAFLDSDDVWELSCL